MLFLEIFNQYDIMCQSMTWKNILLSSVSEEVEIQELFFSLKSYGAYNNFVHCI